MKKTYSLKELIYVCTFIGLTILVALSQLELMRNRQQTEQLRSQLRSQLNEEAYSVSGRILCQNNQFVVYSIDTEATFMHALEVSAVRTSIPDLKSVSFVDGTRNIWTCHMILVAWLDVDEVDYWLSFDPGVDSALATHVCSLKGSLPAVHGFGESGNYCDPFQIPLFDEATVESLPFQIKFVRQKR